MSEDLRPGQLRLRTEPLGAGGVVVTAAGEIDIATARELEATLTTAAAPLAAGDPAVLDLADVGFMDSTGLGALNAARREAEERGVAWRLCAAQAPVRRLLDLTGVGELFAVFPDRASALAAD
jgi:anti-sigma B factor antagonist